MPTLSRTSAATSRFPATQAARLLLYAGLARSTIYNRHAHPFRRNACLIGRNSVPISEASARLQALIVMTDKKLTRSEPSQVRSFLDQLAKLPTITPKASAGRLVFALDATASREPTWQSAQRMQSEMFDVAASLGGIEIQLCYYRGLNEFYASPWTLGADALRKEMARVQCIGGYTQISRVLEHIEREAGHQQIRALVFVGDCMEENVDLLCRRAGELGLMGIRAFVFQEGHDAAAERAFRQIAKLTQGAFCRFDAGSASQLRELLGAVAAYTAGGLSALEEYSRKHEGGALQITHQIKRS